MVPKKLRQAEEVLRAGGALAGLPFGNRLAADIHPAGQSLLGQACPPAVFPDPLTQRGHGHTSFQTLCYQNSTPLTTNYPATIGCGGGKGQLYRFSSRRREAASSRFTVWKAPP